MSGTSLDGLDIAYCVFSFEKGLWSYQIPFAKTIRYTSQIKEKLLKAENTTGEQLSKIDKDFGHFLGKQVKFFIEEKKVEVDFISSHGQTIFHQPNENFTLQIGDINSIAAENGLETIGDFRRLDIALGGQGAPLVPIGDRLLFAQYPYCMNLGGFSNVSFESNGLRKAYDICPVNMVLNYLAAKEGKEYDFGGQMAKSGRVDNELLEKLNSLPYYQNQTQASLGKEWVKENIKPIIESSNLSTRDLLATYTEHISVLLSKNIGGDCLVTGGGAWNTFLIDKVREKTPFEITLPDKTTIDYKEALIFALLGVLRKRGEINVLSSVTGATKDSCSGVIVRG